MVRPIKPLDPRQPLFDLERLLVDRLRVADHARDGAEAHGHAQRAAIGVIGHRTVEDFRIEFIGLAIDVEIGAREQGPQERRAEPHAGQEQFVDECVLGPAQGQRVESRSLEKTGGIARTRVRRAEDERRRQARRLDRLDGRIEFRQRRSIEFLHRRSGKHLRACSRRGHGLYHMGSRSAGGRVLAAFQGIFTGALQSCKSEQGMGYAYAGRDFTQDFVGRGRQRHASISSSRLCRTPATTSPRSTTGCRRITVCARSRSSFC